MQTILNVLILSVTEIVYLLGILIIAGLLLGWIEVVSNRWAYQAFGKAGIMLTACIGTPIHEMGHALMCLLFGHKIIAIKLFVMSPKDSTLGYVNHSFNKHNLYQVIGNFFISIGPIFSGTVAILFFMYMLEPSTFKALEKYVLSASVSNNIVDLIKGSGYCIMIVYTEILNSGNIGSLNFWLFLLLAICTASHMALSKTDIQNAIPGLAATLFVVVLINMGAVLFDVGTFKYVVDASRYNIYLVTVLSISIAFSLVTALIMRIAYEIKNLMMN